MMGSSIEDEVDTLFKTSGIYDVKREFIRMNRDIIRCEPSGMLLRELEYNKITRMRLVD